MGRKGFIWDCLICYSGKAAEDRAITRPGHFLQNKSSTVNGAAWISLTLKASSHPAVPGTQMIDTTSFIKAAKKPSIPVNFVG
jgi:hypothetical protein